MSTGGALQKRRYLTAEDFERLKPKSREEAIAFLKRAGILTEDGGLSPNYYSPEQIAEFCWLVEQFNSEGNSTGLYMADQIELTVTTDPLQARRFTRSRSAMFRAEEMDAKHGPAWRATQHGFIEPSGLREGSLPEGRASAGPRVEPEEPGRNDAPNPQDRAAMATPNDSKTFEQFGHTAGAEAVSDRELLEAAASAAGIEVRWHEPWETHVHVGEWYEGRPLMHRAQMMWNPLADDGDALRLAVKLQLTVCNEHCTAGAVYCTKGLDWSGPVEDARWPGSPDLVVEGDFAATRRAIVRAAAACAPNKDSP